MPRRARAIAAPVVATLTIALAACTSGTAGSASRLPPSAPVAPTRTTLPSGTTLPSATASVPVTAVTVAGGCRANAVAAVLTCVSTSLGSYWSARVGRAVPDRIVYAPVPAGVPADCRTALPVGTAFTCPTDDRVYLTAAFVAKLAARPPATDLPYRLVATMAHEMGHVVQFAVHDKRTETSTSDADSRIVEQQADCLSGVWAASVGYPRAAFLRGVRVVLQVVDNAAERRSHGTPAARIAAVQRGLTGRSAAGCGLTLR